MGVEHILQIGERGGEADFLAARQALLAKSQPIQGVTRLGHVRLESSKSLESFGVKVVRLDLCGEYVGVRGHVAGLLVAAILVVVLGHRLELGRILVLAYGAQVQLADFFVVVRVDGMLDDEDVVVRLRDLCGVAKDIRHA